MTNTLNLDVGIIYIKRLIENLFKHYVSNLRVGIGFLKKKGTATNNKEKEYKICQYPNLFMPTDSYQFENKTKLNKYWQ